MDGIVVTRECSSCRIEDGVLVLRGDSFNEDRGQFPLVNIREFRATKQEVRTRGEQGRTIENNDLGGHVPGGREVVPGA